MPATPSPASPRGEVAVSRGSDGTLRVVLSGSWQLEGRLPSTDVVEQALADGVRGVAFDTQALASWDTSAVTFLVRVNELCKARGIAVDLSGLPAGLQRLLHLAEAVPEKAGARRAATRPPLVARVGAATLAAWKGAREALAFLGEATLAAGRLLTAERASASRTSSSWSRA